jgi:hypothetical protein
MGEKEMKGNSLWFPIRNKKELSTDSEEKKMPGFVHPFSSTFPQWTSTLEEPVRTLRPDFASGHDDTDTEEGCGTGCD